jgi:hypothetical protein
MIGRAACVTHSAPKVRLQLRADLVLRQLLDHAEVAVAGVVDDDVEPAEAGRRGLDGGEAGRAVGDVQGEREHGVAVTLGEVVERGQIAGSRGDSVASLQCGLRPFPAEALGRAGDEPGFRHGFSLPRPCEVEALAGRGVRARR